MGWESVCVQIKDCGLGGWSEATWINSLPKPLSEDCFWLKISHAEVLCFLVFQNLGEVFSDMYLCLLTYSLGDLAFSGTYSWAQRVETILSISFSHLWVLSSSCFQTGGHPSDRWAWTPSRSLCVWAADRHGPWWAGSRRQGCLQGLWGFTLMVMV